MELLLPDPRTEYETLAEALRIFHVYRDHPPSHAITELRDTVAHVTDAWQQCEAHRTTQEKEFRYHVVRLKLLLAGAHHILDALSETGLSQAA